MSLRGVLPVAAAVLALLVPAGAGAAFSPAAVEAELGEGVNAARNSETGRLGFIGTDPGEEIEVPAGSPRAVALDFADSYAAELGIDGARGELDVSEVEGHDDGRTTVRLQQVQDGIPVLGGELTVNLTADGDILSLAGELEPKPADTAITGVSAAEADDVALAAVAKQYGVSAGDLVAAEPERWIYDPRILGGPGLELPRVVWRTEVTDGTAGTAIRELVLVDAEEPMIALNFSQITDAKSRAVCDGQNVLGEDTTCVPAAFERDEGGPPDAQPQVNLVYDRTGGVYDFYASKFGRDSVNNAGLKLLSTVRYCRPGEACPYKNAFWNGSQMTYGDDVIEDDIVGHELSHAVTEFESNLFYYYQSGAINESISDVFGEIFDQSFEPEPAAHRWLVGENSSLGNGVPLPGVIRDMADPTAKNDPDRMTSALYVADLTEVDAGGVHSNSGVNNKAAFLLTDGGSFNGQTIAALGPDKVLALYYETNANLLNSASDYLDLANALAQACTNLGYSAGECAQVDNAIAAVEMRSNPPNSPTRTAGYCLTPGDVPNFAFDDDMEQPSAGNWAHSALSGADRWVYPSALNYATSGTRMLRYFPDSSASDSVIAMTSSVNLPPGAFARFNHAHAFQDSGAAFPDGGIVEYSADRGASWIDAAGLFAFGGYNGETTGGMLGAGRDAFVGESNGYGSSRLDLASLAGQPLRLRFRVGTDATTDPAPSYDYGWFVDDVQIYNCPAETSIDSGPGNGETVRATEASFGFSATDPAATFECSVDDGGYSACSAPFTLTGLADGSHSLAVRSIDPTGAVDPSPASRSYAVDTRCPRAQAEQALLIKKLKKAKKKLKKAKKKGAGRDKVKRLKKKAKKAKKAVREGEAIIASVCA